MVGPEFEGDLVWRKGGRAEMAGAVWRAFAVPIWQGRRDGVSRAHRPRLDFGVERGKFC